MYGYYDSSYWLFMIPAFLLVWLAQQWVNSTYRRWGKTPNSLNVTGADAARRLLQQGNLSDISLTQTSGRLSDHYDPGKKVLALSPAVAQQPSVASLAIAAHEIGHAIQHQEGYGPMRIRSLLVVPAQLGSNLGWILIIIGLILGSTDLAWLGVAAFSAGAVFALATLPVEFNASSRARAMLDDSGLVRTEEERGGVASVLKAAAFTYVAGLGAAVLQLLYWVVRIGALGGRRRS